MLSPSTGDAGGRPLGAAEPQPPHRLLLASPRAILTKIPCYFIVLLPIVLLFLPLLLGLGSFYQEDFLFYSRPLLRFAVAQWSSGHVPGWNPHLFLGTPLLANPAAGALYPLDILLGLLPFSYALHLLVVLHLALLGLFTYLLASQLTGERAAGVLAGLSASLGGVALSYTAAIPFLFALAWAPGALWLLLRSFRRPRPLDAAGAACCLALQLLAGDPQLMAMTMLTMLAMALAPGPAGQAPLGRRLLVLAGIVVLGGCLSMVQLLPALEMVSWSKRAAQGLSQATSWSLHPLRLLELLAPRPYGAMLPEQSFWGHGLLRGPNAPIAEHRFWFFSIYPGLLCPLLALVGLAARHARREALRLALPLLLLLGMALGEHTPFFALVARVLPPVLWFRYPEKYFSLAAILLAVLAAVGLATVRREDASRWRALLLGSALLLALLAAIGLAGVSTRAALIASQLALPHAEAALADSERCLGHLLAICTVLLLVLALARLRAGQQGYGRPRATGWLLVGVAALDLWVAGTGLVWLSEPLPEQAPALAALLRSELDGAPTRLLRDDELDRLWMHRDEVGARQNAVRLVENLRPNGGMEHGVHYLRGYGAGGLAASERLASAASEHPELLGQALAVSRVISALERKNPLIDRLVAQGLLGEIAASRPLDLRIFEVVGTRGMLHLDPETPVEAETCLLDGRVSRCRAAAPCPAATSAAGAGAATGKVQVTSYAPGEIRAEVEVTGECTVLLVADSFYPGWQAWVDGRETEIRRAHGALKAIRLAGGAHRIELRFTTNGFLTGLAISCFSLLIIAGALLASWRRGPRQAGPEVGA